MASDYRPIKFLDRMQRNQHIVLLYDDVKYADLMIARYLMNGLQRGESCIFFAPDKPKDVEARLSAMGIDVDSYKRKNQLRIFSIERSDENKKDVLDTLKGIRENATKGMKPPFRFVGRTITDTATVEGMKLGMTVERTGQEHFDEFDCSQMCYYDIAGIEPTMRDQWLSQLLRNHHHVIYAAEPGKAVAFETELLNEE
jgi:hypothetical protein